MERLAAGEASVGSGERGIVAEARARSLARSEVGFEAGSGRT